MPLPIVTVQGGSVEIDPQIRAKSWIQFGLPLNADSKQSLIPVISMAGQVFGFLPVTVTDFTAGTTTQAMTIEGNSYTLQSVTLPELGSTQTVLDPTQDYRGRVIPNQKGNSEDFRHLNQYMALVLTDYDVKMSQQETAAAAHLSGISFISYRGFATMISAMGTNNETGYYSFWSAPVMYIVHRFSRGAYIDALINNLDITPPSAVTPPNPNPSAASLTWNAVLSPNVDEDCEFFDFNWVEQFQLSPYVAAQGGSNVVVPLTATVVSNPTTPTAGAFKAVVLQSSGQSIYPGGGVTFDTIRILRLKDPAPGTYTFTFDVSYAYSVNGEVPVQVPATLTLVVPTPA